jgi:hypothetical protein
LKSAIPEETTVILTESITSVESSVISLPNVHHQQRKSSIFKSRVSSAQPHMDKNSLVKGETSSLTKGKKGLALYRHTWHEDDARKAASLDSGAAGTTSLSTSSGLSSEDQEHLHPSPWDELGDESEGPPPKLARLGVSSNTLSSITQKLTHSTEPDEDDEQGETPSSLRCPRKVKDYYTVVRNVKKAHQIQESGEFQEFNDDVDYILDALQDRNPTATRY